MRSDLSLLCILLSQTLLGCFPNGDRSDRHHLDAYEALQERLILARPGDIVWIEAGTYHVDRQLTLDVPDVKIKGRGSDRTILSFREQIEGAEGLLVRANGFTIEDLAIHDTKGDGLKIQDADGVTIRRVKVTWTDGPTEHNGAYGLYPVSTRNVLIEDCEVSGASDAGIYVGQTQNAVVRRNRAFHNVAGIEIENSIDVDVYENEVSENASGILVFDLPDLVVKNGRNVRVFDNRVIENNHPNFAPTGTVVSDMPSGTGILIMATDDVEIFGNEVLRHRTINAAVVSYLLTRRPITDPEFSPFTSAVFIRGNHFEAMEAAPDLTRPTGTLIGQLFGQTSPDILYDGTVSPAHLTADGAVMESRRLCVSENGNATFANINAPSDFTEISTNLEPHACTHAPLPMVSLAIR